MKSNLTIQKKTDMKIESLGAVSCSLAFFPCRFKRNTKDAYEMRLGCRKDFVSGTVERGLRTLAIQISRAVAALEER